MKCLKIAFWVLCPVMAIAQPRTPITPLYSYSAVFNNPAMAAKDGENNISLLGSTAWKYKLAALSFEMQMPENSGVLSGVASYMESGFEYMIERQIRFRCFSRSCAAPLPGISSSFQYHPVGV